jgi:hypothetical protein
MTMTNVRVVTDLPGRSPHRFGLFSVVDFGQDARAAGGVAWASLGCAPIQVVQDSCIVSGATDVDLVANVGCYNGKTEPFTVVAFDQSSMGRSPRTAEPAHASDRLALMEPSAVETEVTRQMAVGATDVTVAGGNIARQLGEVEARLAVLGGEGLLLVRRSTIAQNADYFVQTGSVLRTMLGTPVAACAGWSPADPDTVLGVPMIFGSRSAVLTGFGWDMNLNDHGAYAERDYSIGWDCEVVSATAA